MEASIAEIQNEMSSLGKRVAELEEHMDVKDLKEDIKDIRGELNHIKDKLDSHGSRVAEIQVEIAKLETNMTSKIAKLETNMTSKIAKLETNMTSKMFAMFIATITVLGGLIIILQFFA